MTGPSSRKVMSLADAIALIAEGASVALGGNTFHRAPIAAVLEIARQQKKVELIKTAGSYDVDVLVGAGLVQKLQAAYVGFETMGLAPRTRRAIESGQVQLVEHT